MSRIVSKERRRSKSSCSSKYMPSTRIRFRDGRTQKKKKKILCRKIVFFLKYMYEFCNLIQAFFYFIKAVGEHHICHSLFAKRTETFFF